MVDKLTAFTKSYEEQCFAVWFEMGRPTYNKVVDKLPEDEYGRKPSRNVFLVWRNENGWDIRADEIDAKASAITDDKLLNDRIKMVQEQASRAREIQTMGLDYLREEGFDSAASAVSAIVKGADLERQSRGLGEMLVRFSKMDDAKLTDKVNQLLERANLPNDVIDVAKIPERSDESILEDLKELEELEEDEGLEE